MRTDIICRLAEYVFRLLGTPEVLRELTLHERMRLAELGRDWCDALDHGHGDVLRGLSPPPAHQAGRSPVLMGPAGVTADIEALPLEAGCVVPVRVLTTPRPRIASRPAKGRP